MKFRRPVVPGDQLVMKVVLTKLNKRFGIAKMKGQAFVGRSWRRSRVDVGVGVLNTI